MAVKVKKTYSIDSGTAQKFQEVCKRKDLEYSDTLEKFMEDFIRKDGEALIDDLYAPRIAAMVRNEIKNETQGIRSMLHNQHVDIAAILLSIPSVYLKNAEFLENLLDTWINPQLLVDGPEREYVSNNFSYNVHGWEMVENLQNFAQKYLSKKAKEIRAEKLKTESAN